tara:strand:+ start:4980 stop:5360 length:381 start_codon:yes stop_codon:yes gene_type:complete
MEFPEDIWGVIMGYFHSSYKKSLHYICILKNNLFYYTRERNKRLEFLPDSFKSAFIKQMDKIYNSFYMVVVLNTYNIIFKLQSTLKNATSVSLKRRIAKGKVLEDFNNIFEEYKNYKIQYLSQIKY